MMMQSEAYRLLLVGNRVLFRQGLRALLRKFRELNVVGEAADSITALQRARELLPDVILIDDQTPGCDILETTLALRRELPDAKVLILTADVTNHNDPNLIYQAIRAGARGYVSQDSEVEDLVKAIHTVVQGHVVLAPESLTNLVDLITQPDSSAQQSQLVARLTPREREVLNFVAQGITNREIADRLYVSENTVRSHIHNILEKLQLTNRVQVATFAITADAPEQPQKPRRLIRSARTPLARGFAT